MKDYEIVDLYWARDERALTETQHKYGAYCHGISMNILNSEPDAEECVNDTWLKAWQTMPPKKPSVLRTYLGKLTRNLSINRLRERHREKRNLELVIAFEELAECIPDDDDGENLCDLIALQDAMNAFLSGLRRRERNVFIRRYFYASSIAEIADEYFMTQSGVKMMLSRLRQRLKAHLEKEGIDV